MGLSEFKCSDKKVEQLLNKKLYSHAYGTVFIHTVFGGLVTAVLFGKVDTTLLMSWLMLLLMNMSVRLSFIRAWLSASCAQRERRWMRNMALTTSLVSGGLWASTSLFLDFQMYPVESLALSFMVLSLAASAAIYSAFFIPAFYLSVVPYLGSYFIYYLTQFTFESTIIAAILLIFGFMLYRQVNRLHKMHRQSIIQELKNEFLIANMQEKNSKLKEDSNTDFLTKVLNRRSFNKVMNSSWIDHAIKQQPISLIMSDIDHFKNFNDTFGHLVGDKVLVWVAEKINQHIRPDDELFRYGGEEFAIILQNTELDEGVVIAERIRDHIMQDQIDIDGVQHSVTLSLGVSALQPECGTHFECLVNESDNMLLQSKRNGRNRVSSPLDVIEQEKGLY